MSNGKNKIPGFGNGAPENKYPRLEPEVHVIHDVTIPPVTELKDNALLIRFDLRLAYNQVAR
jgi:hypothetical protein